MTLVNLNEIIILLASSANVAISVSSDLYNIQSNYAFEVSSQSASTTSGNEHTIIKSANESTIGTKIAEGELAIIDASASNKKVPTEFLRVAYIQQ